MSSPKTDPKSDPNTFTCQCGEMAWQLKSRKAARHIMCYCADCQTFANHLNCADHYLDGAGTHILQTTPANMCFTKGQDKLGLLQLGPKGAYRWYATCCNTPIANTAKTKKFAFVGLVQPKDRAGLGRVACRLNTSPAYTPMKPHGVGGAVINIASGALSALVTGAIHQTPFFDETGAPSCAPTVLTKDQRTAARP